MPPPEKIVKDLEDLYSRFKRMDSRENQSPKLFMTSKKEGFLDEFSHVLDNNRQQILKYLKEAILIDENGDELWYYEHSPGKAWLLRGTNRNESCHRRFRGFHPEKCGIKLHTCMMIAFTFQWNFHRDGCAASLQDCGLDPAVVRLSNVKELVALGFLNFGSRTTYLIQENRLGPNDPKPSLHNGRVSKQINKVATFGGRGLQSDGAGRGKKEGVYNVYGTTYRHADKEVETGIDLSSARKILTDTANDAQVELRKIPRASWSKESDKLLTDIYYGTAKLKKDKIDWVNITLKWRSCFEPEIDMYHYDKTQLKNRIDIIRSQGSASFEDTSFIEFDNSNNINASYPMDVSSNNIISIYSSSSNNSNINNNKDSSSSSSSSSSNGNSNNNSFSLIASTKSMNMKDFSYAPTNTKFSNAERDLFVDVLRRRPQQARTSRSTVDWTEVAKSYNAAVKDNSMQVGRTKEQLLAHYKSFKKDYDKIIGADSNIGSSSSSSSSSSGSSSSSSRNSNIFSKSVNSDSSKTITSNRNSSINSNNNVVAVAKFFSLPWKKNSCAPDTSLTMLIYFYYEFMIGRANCCRLLRQLPIVNKIVKHLPKSLFEFSKKYIESKREDLMKIVYDLSRDYVRGEYLQFNSVFPDLFRHSGQNKLIDFGHRTSHFSIAPDIPAGTDLAEVPITLASKIESRLESNSSPHCPVLISIPIPRNAVSTGDVSHVVKILGQDYNLHS